MCISPSHVWLQRGPNWEQTPVPCKKCWRCKQNRVNDYVARIMAEAQVSAHTCAITLTYAPRDDLADKILHPKHFQLFMKLLRRAGHKVRYFVAGEYGDLKGRAHFHAILFFTHISRPPDGATVPDYQTYDAPFSLKIPQMRMCHIREWPHGHIKADWSASEKLARYVAKYLLAENKNNAWFSLSKKPPLGAEWFARKAAKARELGVLPSTFNYQPPGCSKDKVYMMTGATRRDYLNAITTDPNLKEHMSEWVLKTFEKHERQRWIDYLESQPLDVLNQAFVNYRAIREHDEAFTRKEYLKKIVDFTDDLIRKSGKPVRKADHPELFIEMRKKDGSSP